MARMPSRTPIKHVLLAVVFSLLCSLATAPMSMVSAASPGSAWQRQNPFPSSGGIERISAANGNHAWAVNGLNGTVRFWDGVSWRSDLVLSSMYGYRTIKDVYALDPSHVWLVAEGRDGDMFSSVYVYFWNGATWKQQSTLNYNGAAAAIYALDANHVWAADVYGRIYFYDGASWTQQYGGEFSVGTQNGWEQGLSAIYATGPNNAWAVGTNTILHWNGSWWAGQWSGDYDLRAISGFDSSHVWVAGTYQDPVQGERGVIMRWNGSAWEEETIPGVAWLSGVSALDENHIWVAGAAHDPVLGDQGIIGAWDGASWNVQKAPGVTQVTGVDALDPNHVWAAGNGEVLFWDGRSWVTQTQGVWAGSIGDVAAPDAGHVWALGEQSILSWKNGNWSTETGTTGRLAGITAPDPQHVWAVGSDGTILFSDGAKWTPQNSNTAEQLSAVSAYDGGHAWAVSEGGAILFGNGKSWVTQQPSGSGRPWYTGVYALDLKHAWAVGSTTAGGIITTWDGSAWSTKKIPGAGTLWPRGVYAADAKHVWVVGQNEHDVGFIASWDGTSWAVQAMPGTFSLNDVSGVDASHVWVVGRLAGGTGVVLAWNGRDWKIQDTGTIQPLRGVDAVDAGHVWAAGDFSEVLYYGPASKIQVIRPNGGEVLASGSSYLVDWIGPSAAKSFKVEYSLDNGASWKTAADNLKETSYQWTVPKPMSNRAKALLRVTGFNSALERVMGQSEAVFAVEVVGLILPNGRSALKQGQTTVISWRVNATSRPVASINVYYSTDAGATWKLLKQRLGPNTRSFDWTTPSVASPNCKVKVVLKDSTGAILGKDVSDSNFSIGP